MMELREKLKEALQYHEGYSHFADEIVSEVIPVVAEYLEGVGEASSFDSERAALWDVARTLRGD